VGVKLKGVSNLPSGTNGENPVPLHLCHEDLAMKKKCDVSGDSLIVLLDVNFGEIALASDLHVIGSPNKVHALEGSRWEGPCSATRLGAPRDLYTLRVADGRARRRWTPEAEVINVAVQKNQRLGAEDARQVTHLSQAVWH
jgi:hypothetical protein